MSALISAKESNSQVECPHVFEFLNTGTSVISCLRNDEISDCLRCGEEYDYILASKYRKFSKSNEKHQKDVPVNHSHIYRKDGTCGSALCFPDMIDPDTGRVTNYGFDDFNDNEFCKISNKTEFVK